MEESGRTNGIYSQPKLKVVPLETGSEELSQQEQLESPSDGSSSVVLSRDDSLSWALMPQVLTRLAKFSVVEHPNALLSGVADAFGRGDPNIFLVAALDSEGKVTGHLMAYIHESATEGVVAHIQHAEMLDDKSDTALTKETMEELITWARQRGATYITAASPKRWKALCRRFGFEYYTTQLKMAL